MSQAEARHLPKGHLKLHTVKLTMGKGGVNTDTTNATQRIALGSGGRPRGGRIVGISLTYSAAANSSGTVTIKEKYSSGATLFASGATATATTNAATGTLLVPCTDGADEANGTVADMAGLYFNGGLWLQYASATAGDYVIVRLLIDHSIRYVKRVVKLSSAADGSAAGTFDVHLKRPGIIRALRCSASTQSTTDLVVKADAFVRDGVPAGATIFTATNFGTAGIASAAGTAVPKGVTTDGLDEANGSVTDPGGGLFFAHGFHGAFAQGGSGESLTAEFWVEQ